MDLSSLMNGGAPSDNTPREARVEAPAKYSPDHPQAQIVHEAIQRALKATGPFIAQAEHRVDATQRAILKARGASQETMVREAMVRIVEQITATVAEAAEITAVPKPMEDALVFVGQVVLVPIDVFTNLLAHIEGEMQELCAQLLEKKS